MKVNRISFEAESSIFNEEEYILEREIPWTNEKETISIQDFFCGGIKIEFNNHNDVEEFITSCFESGYYQRSVDDRNELRPVDDYSDGDYDMNYRGGITIQGNSVIISYGCI